jgi:hypothetical protein
MVNSCFGRLVYFVVTLRFWLRYRRTGTAGMICTNASDSYPLLSCLDRMWILIWCCDFFVTSHQSKHPEVVIFDIPPAPSRRTCVRTWYVYVPYWYVGYTNKQHTRHDGTTHAARRHDTTHSLFCRGEREASCFHSWPDRRHSHHIRGTRSSSPTGRLLTE